MVGEVDFAQSSKFSKLHKCAAAFCSFDAKREYLSTPALLEDEIKRFAYAFKARGRGQSAQSASDQAIKLAQSEELSRKPRPS